MTDDVVLVNDLDSLREAIVQIDDFHDRYTEWDDDAWRTIRNLVPRLIKSYEDLLEASFELTRLVELEHQNRTPEGLYLP